MLTVRDKAPFPQPNGPTLLRELSALAARGMEWIPKRSNNNNNNVDVVDTTFEQITAVEQGNEIELTTLVEKVLVVQSQKRTAKDNIRKNHYSAKNKNVVCLALHFKSLFLSNLHRTPSLLLSPKSLMLDLTCKQLE